MSRLSIPQSDEEYWDLLEKGVFDLASDAPTPVRRRDPIERASIKFAENIGTLTDALLDRAGLYRESASSHELTPEGADVFLDIYFSAAKYICDNHFKKQSLDFSYAEDYLRVAWKFRDEIKELSESKKEILHKAVMNHNGRIVRKRPS